MAQTVTTFTHHEKHEDTAIGTDAACEKSRSLLGASLAAFIGVPVVIVAVYLALFAPF